MRNQFLYSSRNYGIEMVRWTGIGSTCDPTSVTSVSWGVDQPIGREKEWNLSLKLTVTVRTVRNCSGRDCLWVR